MVVDTAKVSVCPRVSSLMRRDKKAATPSNYESKELLRKGMDNPLEGIWQLKNISYRQRITDALKCSCSSSKCATVDPLAQILRWCKSLYLPWPRYQHATLQQLVKCPVGL